jgi:sulfonate transport system substrate-binding protein
MNHRSVSAASWLAFTLSLLALVACEKKPDTEQKAAQTASSSEAPRSAPTAQENTVVQLGYQKIGAPFLLKSRSASLDKRLEGHSARAEWKEFKHGPGILEAINAKEVDIGYVGETPPVFAQSGGVDFVYVAADPPAPKSEAIVVLKDSPIEKVADLKGKKIALNRGSNVHFLLVKALESAKLGISDVEVVYLAPGDARPAYETGKVDAWVIWDPFFAAAEVAGSRVLVDGAGLVDNEFFYVVRRQFAQAHPEIVRDVLAEYQALSEWEGKNAEEASRALAASSGVSYEALLLAERRHSYGIVPITPELLQKQQVIADTFQKLKLIPNAIHTTEAFYPAVVYAKAE